jgi:uncharacterized protein YjeT (DUF2065 family)
MTLSVWSYLLGALFLFGGGAALACPAAAGRLCKAFPRSKAAGWVLSLVAWVWAGFATNEMGLDFLDPYKKFIPVIVAVCIPLTWWWLSNLLPCRALGGIYTLFPYWLLHVARIHPSPWRLALVAVAYLFIVWGMVLILYPWKLRQLIDWLTASEGRMRLAAAARIAIGIFLAVLGATAL